MAAVLGTATSVFGARQEPITPIEPTKVENVAKVELGKLLYFDKRLSKSGVISCNSCHDLSLGGVDNTKTSIGHGWHIGPINAPTVYNAKYHLAQFWDGRAKDLKEQAGGPIQAPGEMGSTHELATKTIASIPGYKPYFKNAFGDEKVSIDRITGAIAAFEETLVTPNSRFDQWLKGNDKAITKDELLGYETFKTKGCIGCHSGPAVGGNSFQKLGVVKPYPNDKETLGRFNVTKNPADKFVFKVPSLRNVDLTYPYFHDGSVWSLEEAVKIMAEIQLAQKLTNKETKQIVAFLKTLRGERASFELPLLPPSEPETPQPQITLR